MWEIFFFLNDKQSYINRVYIHGYYSNFVNLLFFSLIDVGDFRTWMCKFDIFFYYTIINADAPRHDEFGFHNGT